MLKCGWENLNWDDREKNLGSPRIVLVCLVLRDETVFVPGFPIGCDHLCPEILGRSGRGAEVESFFVLFISCREVFVDQARPEW